MTESTGGLVGYVRGQVKGPLTVLGGFFRMTVLTGKALFNWPPQWNEVIQQCWFIMRVALLPTIMVSIPLTVLLIFTLNILLKEVGAADLSGAGAGIGVVTQLGPLATVLVVAGAGSTAICADLGARTIREEIDAMEVLGIDPIYRLVVPRVIAATIVSTLLNGLVITVGLVGGYIFGVYLQNVSGGAYLATLTTLTGLPEVIIATVKADGVRAHCRPGRLLPRADRRRRLQGPGHRSQRNRGAVRGRAVRGERHIDHDRCAVRNG